MPTDAFPCSLEDRISADFHPEVRSECERCQNGRGQCLIMLMLRALGQDLHEAAGD